MTFDEADKVVHKVENEWHYLILIRYGFTAETKEGVGFVRSYIYVHPKGYRIQYNHGIYADYWGVLEPRPTHVPPPTDIWWSHLEPYLQSLTT